LLSYLLDNADVTSEEIAAAHGNISAVFIIRVIDRRARALNELAASAMEMVDRQFGHQIVPKVGQLFSSIRSSTLAFVRQKTTAIMRWVREEDMPDKVGSKNWAQVCLGARLSHSFSR
jgi:hypothetical protein